MAGKDTNKNIFFILQKYFFDKINTIIILLSIVGLVLEYTSLKRYVVNINKAFDIYFVIDFLVRLLGNPFNKYFFKGYGWVDFLASLPGFFILMESTPILRFFKIVRIGRFFKMIRLLRFLRFFSFIKKMKDDSVYIQERIMQIGVTIVMVYIIGISITDIFLKQILEREDINSFKMSYELVFDKDLEKMVKHTPKIFVFFKNGIIFERNGQTVNTEGMKKIANIFDDENSYYIEIPLSSEYVVRNNLKYPKDGVIIKSETFIKNYNKIMVTSVLVLIVILVIMLFYIGGIFAEDMRKVQLIIDSIDADDYLILKEEVKKYMDSEGNLKIQKDENEMDSLMKMVGKLILEKDSYGSSGSYNDIFSNSYQDEGKTQVIDEEMIKKIAKETSVETIKLLSKSVADFLEKRLKK